MINKFKDILPLKRSEIEIIARKDISFDISLKEVPWMFCDIEVGKQVVWGIYEAPNWNLTEAHVCSTKRYANIHGIDCVETEIHEYNPTEENNPKNKYSLYSRADETTIQFIAESYISNNTLKFLTLYDDAFMKNWGAENYRIIKNNGYNIYKDNTDTIIEIDTIDESIFIGAGIYEVRIGRETFECLRVFDRFKDTLGVLIEAFIDRNGKTILCRRYNSPDWEYHGFSGKWDELLPNSRKIIINNKEYIHWYDCFSDIVFSK